LIIHLFLQEELLFEEYGEFDMLIYLKFAKYSALLFLALTIIGIAPLVVNITGENKIKSDEVLSMSNIAKGSPRLYCHVISLVCITFVVCLYIYKLMLEVFHARVAHLKHHHPQGRSVMVKNLKEPFCSNQAFRTTFENIYGRDKIVHAYVPHSTSKLGHLLRQREKLVRKWKKEVAYREEFQRVSFL